jgi:hypothetical protein
MQVQYCDSEFDVPDLLIHKFAKDFDCLPGSGKNEEVNQLRGAIYEVLDLVAEDPDLLHEQEYLTDFFRALAMKKAMEINGIMYDS